MLNYSFEIVLLQNSQRFQEAVRGGNIHEAESLLQKLNVISDDMLYMPR